jgi:acyl CoA:acetate/3-ketoacid CoA transferase beta subunit
VISNLGVFDFATPDRSMRLASLHPGVSVEQVVANTAFELAIPSDVPVTRAPSASELALMREQIDPEGAANKEVR